MFFSLEKLPVEKFEHVIASLPSDLNDLVEETHMSLNEPIPFTTETVSLDLDPVPSETNISEVPLELVSQPKEQPLMLPVIDQQEETFVSEKKSLKRNRRRKSRFFYSLKRRRRQSGKSLTITLTESNVQDIDSISNKSLGEDERNVPFWQEKYSTEPISILLQRCSLPT